MWILIKPARMVNTDAIKEIHVSGCGVYYSTFDSENVYNLIGKYETQQQAKKSDRGYRVRDSAGAESLSRSGR